MIEQKEYLVSQHELMQAGTYLEFLRMWGCLTKKGHIKKNNTIMQMIQSIEFHPDREMITLPEDQYHILFKTEKK